MLDEALVRAVRAVHEVFMATSDRVAADLAGIDLTHATAAALWALEPDEVPPSMKVLAARLFCNAPNLSFLVGQLESRGLVERSVDPTDRRSRTVALTAAGVRTRAEVVRVTLGTTPLAALGAAGLHDLVALLGPVLDRVHEPAAGAETDSSR